MTPKKEEPEKSICQRIKECPFEEQILRPVPSEIEWNLIPDFDEVTRKAWRAGMRKLEEVFAEHCANMHNEFEFRLKTHIKA